MKRLRGKLTYANVISTLCLFLVLGGGAAFATSMYPKESIGPRALKKGAVTFAKIKDGAVKGSKINLPSLGTVPSAQTATTANSAKTAGTAGSAATATKATTAENANSLGGVPASGYARNQLEAPHVVTALEGGCGSLSGTFAPVGFYKDPFGIVHLEGFVESCTAATGPTFTLPVGFRSATSRIYAIRVEENTVGTIRVDANGAIERFGLKRGSLEGVTFRAG
jgi:hypothetical protein